MKKIDTNHYSIRLTEETVRSILVERCGWTEESDFGIIHYFRSPCKRYALQESDSTNLYDPHTMKGWNLHIDNSDMQSLASCDVEYIGQISDLIKIYNRY